MVVGFSALLTRCWILCRKSAVGGSEPTDAIRAVNALLTQLDALKRFPNVMILTTSNITGRQVARACALKIQCVWPGFAEGKE